MAKLVGAIIGLVVGLIAGAVLFDQGPGLEPLVIVLGAVGAAVGVASGPATTRRR